METAKFLTAEERLGRARRRRRGRLSERTSQESLSSKHVMSQIRRVCHIAYTSHYNTTMEEDSEMSQIFPGEDNVDLYDVLALKSDTSQEDIRKAYRKLALLCHPDKHTNSSEHERTHALRRFQQIGFAYTVLSDEKRRKKYDRTGTTGESLIDPGDDGGWDAYFQDLFDRVTRGRLDQMKEEYQGSCQIDNTLR